MGKMLCTTVLLGLTIGAITACSTIEEEQGSITAALPCRDCCICPNPCCCSSPIVLDLAGDGVRFTSWKDGVAFPLVPWRPTSLRAWTQPNSDDAWLFLDQNDDGMVTNGTELFGDITPQPPPPNGEEKNGFLALAQYDENSDLVIDQRDEVFNRLRLWQDSLIRDGISQSEELHKLLDVGVAGISVTYSEILVPDEFGNMIRWAAPVYGTPGSKVGEWAWDVLLASPRKAEREAYGVRLIPVPVDDSIPAEETPAEETQDPSMQNGIRICEYNRHIYDPWYSDVEDYVIDSEVWWDLNVAPSTPCNAVLADLTVALRTRYQGSWWRKAEKRQTVPEFQKVKKGYTCPYSENSKWVATIRSQLIRAGDPIDLGIFLSYSDQVTLTCSAYPPPEPECN